MNMKRFFDLEDAQRYCKEQYDHEIESLQFTSETQEADTDCIENSACILEAEDYVIIGCLQQDEASGDFWEDHHDGILQLFSRANYEQLNKDIKKSKKLYYLIDKYEHGNVHYSVASSCGYADNQFDVSHGCGIYIPPEDIQKEYKKMKRKDGEAEAFKHYVAYANSVLNQYSDWCNGEVYGYNINVYDKAGNIIDQDNIIWGFIGQKNAEKDLIDTMMSIKSNYECEKLAENVVVETFDAKHSSHLPFSIDTQNLLEYQYSHVYDTHIVAARYSEENKAIVYSFNDENKELKTGIFNEWQIKHGVTTDKFLEARMKSDIKEAIRNALKKNVSRSTLHP